MCLFFFFVNVGFLLVSRIRICFVRFAFLFKIYEVYVAEIYQVLLLVEIVCACIAYSSLSIPRNITESLFM